MTPTYNIPIDDELLAAYLDSHLEGEQAEYVENAIENSPELQWTVDRWIEMQMNPDKEEVVDVEEDAKIATTRKFTINRIVYIAASILLLIGITLPINNSSKINPYSGIPYDFPVSERIPMEYFDLTGKDVELIDEPEEEFSYRYKIHKSAIVFMWGRRIEHAEIVLYSSNGTRLVWGTMENHSTVAFPHARIHESDKPIWASLKFHDDDFYLADSVMINF